MKRKLSWQPPDTRTRYPMTPFPDGWYVVELSRRLRPGKLLGRQWLGRHIVAWRDDLGRVCVADAFCPHMGARLSPETGGRLEDGKLVCPFHGFVYDASGDCVSVPNAKPPTGCSLGVFPVQEANGFIFAYWDNAGRAPHWRPPEVAEDGWTGLKWKRFSVVGHPQDIAENAVDVNHLGCVHGWEQGRQTAKPEIDGPHFRSGFRFTVRSNLPGLRHLRNDSSLTVHIWGLGYLRVDARAHATGMDLRSWFMSTPVDGDRYDVLIATQIKKAGAKSRLPKLIHQVVERLGTEVGRWVAMFENAREFQKDSVIWNHRVYREDPPLCASDGDLFRFRLYCKQFFPESVAHANGAAVRTK